MDRIFAFRDILEERRSEFCNLVWSSRELASYQRDVTRVPKTLKSNVFNSRSVQALIHKISREGGVPVKEVEEQVRQILDEIGFERHLQIIRWLSYVLAKICCKVCTSIYVNEDKVNLIKSYIKNVPVIYLPNHRSYADFILMSYVLFSFDITLPGIAGGMDFYSMRGMGTVLRNTGAFFMRRSYNEDNLYWDTFRQYIRQIVTRGDSGIEFFVEGMRSRSNKALPPKYGLLLMTMRAFIMSEVPDIIFVPINISYDRILEEKLFAFELLGIPKPKESTKGFFKSLSILKESYGRIYVNFGDPITAREFFSDKISKHKYTKKPSHLQETTFEDKQQVAKLAEKIIITQKRLTIVSGFNLIAAILADNSISRRTSIHSEELIREVVWLKGVIENFGGTTDLTDADKCLRDALVIHKNLIGVDEDSNVFIVQNEVKLCDVDVSKMKGHQLSERTMSTALPFIMLQIYVNPMLHLIINQAILVVCLQCHNFKSICRDVLFQRFNYLRLLFMKEFTFFSDSNEKDFMKSLSDLSNLRVIKTEAEEYKFSENVKLQQFLGNQIKPFLLCYYIVCLVLKSLPINFYSEKNIMEMCQEKMEAVMGMDGVFLHPYALSLDTISICVQNLVSLNALQRNRLNGSMVYKADGVRLLETIKEIEKFVPKCFKDIVPNQTHLQMKL